MKDKLLLPALIILFFGFCFIFLFSCYQYVHELRAAREIHLVSPDKKITLAATTGELLSKINTSTRSTEATKITGVEFIHSPKGYYSIVTYQKKDGGSANILYSNFFISSTSAHIIMETETNANNSQGTACYEYWFSPADNCSGCRVQVTSPGTNIVVACNCNQCHLHQRQYTCRS